MTQPFKKLHWSNSFELDQYLTPASLQEALDLLGRFQGAAKVIAGGTDVIPQLRGGATGVKALVDITRLPGMSGIEQRGEKIVIGGLVTHAQAAASELIREKASLLAQGCGSVGSPQIRQVATLAGNLVSGQPAADATIPLLALDATVKIAAPQGERAVPLSEFFLDLGKVALDPRREILTSIEFEGLGPHQGSSYQRLAKRKALTLPMLVCAIKVGVNPVKHTFDQVAIALGPVAPMPWRERRSEELLLHQEVSRQAVSGAAEESAAYCSPRDSLLRGTCDYRQEMVKVLVRRGLEMALEQAGHPLP